MAASSHSSNRAKKSLFYKLLLRKLTTAILIFSLFFSTSAKIAHAGVFSFVSDFFKTEVSAEETATPSGINAQNMPLLQAATNRDPNPSKGGGDISVIDGSALLSEMGPSGTLADIESRAQSGEISIYVVRRGDSLSGIAAMFGVSTDTIRWANDLKSGSLVVGETLVILPISGVRHRVKRGDTLQSIAKKYKGDVEDILHYNSLTLGDALTVGDVVVIPDGEIIAETPKSKDISSRVHSIASGPSFEGYYRRPVDGGRRSQGIHGYNGVDIAAPSGTSVHAAAAGEVIISRASGWNGGYGNYIVIKHDNGTQTLYAHNQSNAVSVGERVTQGQVIGYVGSTGKSTGNHLHFEVRGAKNPF